MKLTDNEIIILKQIIQNINHKYERGFQCKCGHVHSERFKLHHAETNNSFGSHVCSNCGENAWWHDVKIKTITFDLKKIKKLEVIEKI